MFANGLHRFLLTECPDQGPVLSDWRHVPDLGYADDFVLIADTRGPRRLAEAYRCHHSFLCCHRDANLYSKDQGSGVGR